MSEKWYSGVTRGQWMALIAALLGWMFDGFEMGIFPMVARPALQDLLNTSDDSLVGIWNGAIIAAFLFGAALGGWLFGWLGDRIGRVRAMIFSVLTYACFTGFCAFSQDAWQLATLRFIAALGMGGEWSLGVALVMESWPARSRPVLAGLIGAAANVGFVLTAIISKLVDASGFQIADGGWRWVLGIAAFPALLTFFIRLFVPESEKWVAASRTSPKASMLDIFKNGLAKRTIVAALLAGIALIGTWSSVQNIVQWTNQMTDGDQRSAELAQISSGIGAIIGSFLGAYLGSRISRRYGYFFLALMSLIVCQFLFRYFDVITDTSIRLGISFFATVFLVGGFSAAFYGWLPLYLPELFPTRVRATGQGFCFNFGRILAAFGALSTGWLMSKEGPFAGSFAQASATLSLVYIAGMIVIWFAPETKGKPLPE